MDATGERNPNGQLTAIDGSKRAQVTSISEERARSLEAGLQGLTDKSSKAGVDLSIGDQDKLLEHALNSVTEEKKRGVTLVTEERLKPLEEGLQARTNEQERGVKALIEESFKPLEVVISGAGPAGLLLAHYFLDKGEGRFRVSIFDRRDDPRRTRDESDPGIRRYSIGLSKRGAAAIAPIHDLWSALAAAGTRITTFSFTLFGYTYSAKIPPEEAPLAVDRMDLCAVLLESLLGKHGPGGSNLLNVTFNARCIGADLRGHVATFEDVSGPDGKKRHVAPYDLLVGADGARSRVRLAMLEGIWGFDVEQRTMDIANVITYIPPPEGIAPGNMRRVDALPKCKNLAGLLLPGTKDKLCLSLSWSDTCPPEEWLSIKSTEEAKTFLETQIPWLGEIPKEAIEDLRAQKPFRTTVVKCNRYHDAAAAVALVGDAAHATPPFIGQGCNVALEDAATLAHLLLRAAGVRTDDEIATRLAKLDTERGKEVQSDAAATTRDTMRARLPAALEVYSALRVPEGHALVDLSESRVPFSTAQRVRLAAGEIWKILLLFVSRGLFHGPVRAQAGGTTIPLAEVLQRNKGEVQGVLESNKCIREAWQKKEREKKLKEGLAVLLSEA